MKYIFEHMLEAVIVGAVVLGLVFIFHNTTIISKDGLESKGFLNIIATQFKMQNTKEENSDNLDFMNVIAQKKPEISYIEDELDKIKSNRNINILNYFKIQFANDSNLYTASSMDSKYLSVLDITDIRGNSILSAYNAQSKLLCFPNSGIYTIKMCLSDFENRTITAAIKIAVES